MPAITIRSLSKRFRAVDALADIDLDVDQGEGVALLGENGAGKSTLLRILATAVIPDAGQVSVAGHDVLAAPTLARSSLGFLLPDERSWYWRLTGRHNLEFFAALQGMSRIQAGSRADELLQAVQLGEAAERRFDEYSSGMRLRLSLARALLSHPPVLLLDEPTRSIDPIARGHFHTLLKEMIGTQHAAVLLATHDLHEATELASRCVFLVNGRIAGTTSSWSDESDLERQLRSAAA